MTTDPYAALKQYRQWICHRDKVPTNADGSARINPHDASHWMSYDEAVATGMEVGFVFTEADPFFLLDIDHCFVDGDWTPNAKTMCGMFPGALVEVSRGGDGLHVIGSCVHPMAHGCKNKANDLEFYTKLRFMTLGNVESARGDAGAEFDIGPFVTDYFPEPQGASVEWTTGPKEGWVGEADDGALLHKLMTTTPRRTAAQAFGNQPESCPFSAIWGKQEDVLLEYWRKADGTVDYSSVDSSLATRLMLATGGDCDRTWRLMWMSGLVREKWTRNKTYLQRTIQKALGFAWDQIQVSAPAVQVQVAISSEAQQLADDIRFALPVEAGVDVHVIQRMLQGAFWSSAKGKMNLLTKTGRLGSFVEKDAWTHLTMAFGHVTNGQEIEDLMRQRRDDTGQREIDQAINTARRLVINYLKHCNQREYMRVSVDMFADYPSIEIGDEWVHVKYTYKPLVAPLAAFREDVITEFKRHAPILDDLLGALPAARFARDRKRAYLWLHCDSDWGKGMLFDQIKEIVTEVSGTEIERAYEGTPLGKDEIHFRRSIVLLVDEFKAVKSEMKQLQNEMTISPKHLMQVTVPLYMKVFTSAELVESLVGEDGVEKQFANRFSYYRGKGSVENLPLFQELGSGEYADHLKTYMVQVLNFEMARYIALGEVEAARMGDRWLRAFNDKYGIAKAFETYDMSLSDVAQEVIDWCHTERARATGLHDVQDAMVQSKEGHWFLKRPHSIVLKWIELHRSPSSRRTLARSSVEIRERMSSNGECGKNKHRVRTIDGTEIEAKGIWLRSSGTVPGTSFGGSEVPAETQAGRGFH